MQSRDFCFWLQGFLELRDQDHAGLTSAQVESVGKHLALVFKHEIDPAMGPPEHQAKLNETHHGFPKQDPLMRC